MHLRFLGPIRSPDIPPHQDPFADISSPLSEIDQVIRAYQAGDELAIPNDLKAAIYNRAIRLWITENDEPARLLLHSLHASDPKCSQLLEACDTNFPFSWMRVVDAFLIKSSDDFGMALECKNFDFHATPDNKAFLELLWTAFVQMCEADDKTRIVASRIFPLMVFVARSPPALGDYCRKLALLSSAVDMIEDETFESMLSLITKDGVSDEHEFQIFSELFYFVGLEHPTIRERFMKTHPLGSRLPGPSASEPRNHALFLDMMSVYMSIGYASAPEWSHNVIVAIERYASELNILNDDLQMDELVASVFFKAVAIREPFHVARRFITLLWNVTVGDGEDTAFTLSLTRLLKNETLVVSSDDAKKNLQLTIEKVIDGLQLLADSLKDESDQKNLIMAINMLRKEDQVKRTKRDSLEIKVQSHDAPYLLIPQSMIKIVEPTLIENEEIIGHYEAFKNVAESEDQYLVFRQLCPILDPLESHILGIPATSIVICFASVDAKTEEEKDPRARVILLEFS